VKTAGPEEPVVTVSLYVKYLLNERAKV